MDPTESRWIMNPTESCWVTGEYTDECECEFCRHKAECSGYTDEDEEEI